MNEMVCISCIAILIVPLITYGWWLRMEDNQVIPYVATVLPLRAKIKFAVMIYLIFLQHMGLDFPMGNINIDISEPKQSALQVIKLDRTYTRRHSRCEIYSSNICPKEKYFLRAISGYCE